MADEAFAVSDKIFRKLKEERLSFVSVYWEKNIQPKIEEAAKIGLDYIFVNLSENERFSDDDFVYFGNDLCYNLTRYCEQKGPSEYYIPIMISWAPTKKDTV